MRIANGFLCGFGMLVDENRLLVAPNGKSAQKC